MPSTVSWKQTALDTLANHRELNTTEFKDIVAGLARAMRKDEGSAAFTYANRSITVVFETRKSRATPTAPPTPCGRGRTSTST